MKIAGKFTLTKCSGNILLLDRFGRAAPWRPFESVTGEGGRGREGYWVETPLYSLLFVSPLCVSPSTLNSFVCFGLGTLGFIAFLSSTRRLSCPV